MSRDRGSINFDFEDNLQPDEWIELLEKLSTNGWRYRAAANMHVCITPPNSNTIDWNGTDLTDNKIKEIIKEKQKVSEPFGIALHLSENYDANISDDIILYQYEDIFSIWLSDRASDIKGSLIVDYNHYLLIFLPVIWHFRKGFEMSISAYVDRV